MFGLGAIVELAVISEGLKMVTGVQHHETHELGTGHASQAPAVPTVSTLLALNMLEGEERGR